MVQGRLDVELKAREICGEGYRGGGDFGAFLEEVVGRTCDVESSTASCQWWGIDRSLGLWAAGTVPLAQEGYS